MKEVEASTRQELESVMPRAQRERKKSKPLGQRGARLLVSQKPTGQTLHFKNAACRARWDRENEAAKAHGEAALKALLQACTKPVFVYRGLDIDIFRGVSRQQRRQQSRDGVSNG